VSIEPGTIKATVTFPESFTGFKGHFPGRPIVPGVCKIMVVVVLLERGVRRIVRIQEITLAKFYQPVGPSQAVNVEVAWEACEDTILSARALFFLTGQKIAEIKLRCSYE
jgi:3-hydroxymyristoyl/3-hydroxydecanoyl-(acyl carrier protein) dehydratase